MLAAAALLVLALASPSAAAPRAADAFVRRTTGPFPPRGGGPGWVQCAALDVAAPSSAGGALGGWLEITGGRIVKAEGGPVRLAEAGSKDAARRYVLEAASAARDGEHVVGHPAAYYLGPGEALSVPFCVGYDRAWSAQWAVAVDAPENPSPNLQPVSMFPRQQPGMFYKDYSSGQCRCLASGVSPPPPPPPPADVRQETTTANNAPPTTTAPPIVATTTAAPATTYVPALAVIAEEPFDYEQGSIAGRNGGWGWSDAWYKSSPSFDPLYVSSDSFLTSSGASTTVKASARHLEMNISSANTHKAYVAVSLYLASTQNGLGTPTFRFLDSNNLAQLALGNNGYNGAYRGPYALLWNNLTQYIVTNDTAFRLANLVYALVEVDYDAGLTNLWMDSTTEFSDLLTTGVPTTAPALTAPAAPAFWGFDIVVRTMYALDNIRVWLLPRTPLPPRTTSTTSRTTTQTTNTRTSTTSRTRVTGTALPELVAEEQFDAYPAGGFGWSGGWFQTSVNFAELSVREQSPGSDSMSMFYDNDIYTGTEVRASGRLLSSPISSATARKAYVAFRAQFTDQNGFGTPTFRLVNSTLNALLAVGNNGFDGDNWGLLYDYLQGHSIAAGYPLSSSYGALLLVDYDAGTSSLWLDAAKDFDLLYGGLPQGDPLVTVPDAPGFAGFDVVMRGLEVLDDIRVYVLPR
ncbi:hypothetical protein DFJ74DRAFT_714371 [Hyaloraphidium curvatum]|nr:hypothetical protein DFJ74DRAFT_714371 [Hyaloraphidium curvatum]